MYAWKYSLQTLLDNGWFEVLIDYTLGNVCSEVSVRYLRPAFYDDLLEIETIPVSCEGARIHLEYRVKNSKGDLLSTGATVLASVDMKKRRPVRLPAELVDLAKATIKSQETDS